MNHFAAHAPARPTASIASDVARRTTALAEFSRRVCRVLVIIATMGYVRPDVFDELPIVIWWILLVGAVAVPFLVVAL